MEHHIFCLYFLLYVHSYAPCCIVDVHDHAQPCCYGDSFILFKSNYTKLQTNVTNATQSYTVYTTVKSELHD